MKHLNTCLYATILCASIPFTAALAEESPISANIALTTDYLFRGVSQTDSGMALQGGFDFNHDSGFYLGTWMSNVDFDDDDTQMELDTYIGFGGGEEITWDINYTHFFYPDNGGQDIDYGELHAGMGVAFLTADLYYSNDIYASDENGWYFNMGASFDIMDNVTIGGNVGYSILEYLPGDDTYIDYQFSVATTVAGLGVDLSYINSDGDAEDIFGSDNTDGRVVFTISKSL